MNEEEIYLQATRIGSSTERSKYLDVACGDDFELREQIDAMLDEDGYLTTGGALEAEDPSRELAELADGRMIGPYKLMERIGEGGMGAIFVAQQEQPVRRRVAVKVIKPGMDSKEVLARFDAERQALAMMDHPNIARVLDAGATDTGRPYFVMELVRGIPITRFCDNHKLDSTSRLQLFVDVCRAIQHAHQKGIIHRDIKPNNVLVTLHDGKPVVKVIDFGVAKAINQQLTERTVYTKFSQVVGTPRYMSPEQAEMSGLDIDTRSDIYSLGVLLYELLTGDTPLDRQRMKAAAYDEMRRIIREEDPPRPSTRISTLGDSAESVSASRGTDPRHLAHQLRGDLDWIVMKSLEKDRTRRYETANGLGMDVLRYLNHEPVLATPPSTLYRMKKLIRRNQGAFVAATVITILLIAGVAGTTYGLIAAMRANRTIQSQNNELDRSNQDLIQANESIANTNQKLQLANQREAGARKRAESVTNFLVSAFRKVDPDQEGHKLTVVEVLNRSIGEIESDLADDPQTQADLLAAIGRSYRGLGMHADSLAVFDRERTIRVDINQPADRDRLLAEYNYGLALYYEARYQEAIDRLEQVIARQQEAFGDSNTETLTSKNALAMCCTAVGQSDQALELYQAIAKKRREVDGEDHSSTLTAVNNLATAYQARGEYDKALSLFQQNLEKRKRLQGEDHRLTWLAMDRLGSIHKAMGQFRKAIPLYEEAFAKRHAKLGPDHPDTLESISGLAFAHRDAGDLDKAVDILNQVLETKRERRGGDHHSTISSMNDLARIYLALGRYDEALPLVKESFETHRKLAGPQAAKTVAAMNTLGMTYFMAGKPEMSVPVFEELLTLYKNSQDDDHPTTITVMNNLAMSYRDVGRLQEAKRLFEETLAWREQHLDANHPKTLISQANLASIYTSLGDLDKSIELSEETVKQHQATLGKPHRQTISAMIGLTSAYVEQWDLHDGLPLARETLALAIPEMGNDHPMTLRAIRALGMALLQSGHTSEAQQRLEQTLQLRQEKLGAEHPATIRSISDLAQAKLAAGATAESRQLAQQAYAKSQERFNDEHPITLQAARVLGEAILAEGESEEAIELLQTAVKRHEAKLGADHPATLIAQYHLAKALAANQSWDAAEQLLQATITKQTEKFGAANLQTLKTKLLYAQCATQLQHFEPATQALDAAWQSRPDNNHQQLLPVEQALIRQIASQGVLLFKQWNQPASLAQWQQRLDSL